MTRTRTRTITRKQTGLGYAENKELFSGIKHKDQARVRRAIRLGANINARSDFETPLILACRKGDRTIIQEILSNRPNVNAKDNYGWTALLRAVQNCKKDDVFSVTHTLLEAGADANAANDQGMTPLIMVCSRAGEGYYSGKLGAVALDVARLLIANGATIIQVTSDGKTALSEAANSDNTELVRELLRLGGNPNTTTPNNMETILMKAVGHNNLDMVRDILSYGADPNLKMLNGTTAVILAGREHPNIMRELIRRGGDVNATNDSGQTAMSEAHSEDMVRLLLNNGFVLGGYVQGPNIPPHTRSKRDKLILDNETFKNIRKDERRSAVEFVTRPNMFSPLPAMIGSYLGGRRTRRHR